MLIGIGTGVGFRSGRTGSGGSTLHVYDSFNRTDSAASLGVADTGQSWSALSGTWGISSNRAYNVSDVNGEVATIDAGVANFTLSAILNGQTSATHQRFFNIVFHGLDSLNFLFTRISINDVQLYKNVAGVLTSLASVAIVAVDNTDYLFKVVCSGNSIDIYVDGVLKISHTLAGGDTAFAAYTKAGLRLTKGGTPVGTARADEFIVQV